MFASEVDPWAKHVCKQLFPAVRDLGDITEITEAELKQVILDCPLFERMLLSGGFPCQDLSGANAMRSGLQGKRSCLFFEFLRVRDLVKKLFPHAQVDILVENVASMPAPDRDVISQKLGVRPYRICPSDIWPCRRPRYFWTSWTLQASSNLRLEDHGSYLQVRMLGEKLPVQAVLEKHESTAANFTKFPTFLRSVPKKRPPFKPSGLDTCNAWELQQWENQGFRFSPYQFRKDNTVLDRRSGCWNPPSTPTRELLMGFKANATFLGGCRERKNLDAETARDIRQSLLGNAMHVGVVAILLSDYSNKFLVSRAPFTPSQLAFQEPSTRRHAGERLVKAYLARQGHRGFEIRLEDGPERSRTKPGRQELPACSWQWKDVISTAWQQPGEHINTLDMRALTLALRLRARSVKHLRKKFIHLCDSMVSLGTFTRHRSKARSHSYVVMRACALQLAADFHPVLAYIRSASNPADKPSRRCLRVFKPSKRPTKIVRPRMAAAA